MFFAEEEGERNAEKEDDKEEKFRVSAAVIEKELLRMGFLDPSLGVREERSLRDPMLTILYDPLKEVQLDEGATTTTVIDSLLASAHAEMIRAYGDIYTEFAFVQQTMETLMQSTDTAAKLMVVLCLIAIDEGLQNQLLTMYPMDGGPEARRLPEFVRVIKAQMEEIFNTAYINVPRPSRYNVETLMARFLVTCATKYPG